MKRIVATFRVVRVEECSTYDSEQKTRIVEGDFVEVRFETTAANQTQAYFSLKLPIAMSPNLYFGQNVDLVVESPARD